MKKFVLGVVFSVVCVTAAFAAPAEVHSFADLQAISSTQLVELNGDGGRKATLTVDMVVTEDITVLCGSDTPLPVGTIVRDGSVVYVWLLPIMGQPTPAPTPALDQTPAPKREEPVEVASFEELAAISFKPLVNNDDGGRGATLTKPLRVGPGQKVLCNSENPLPEGAIVYPDGSIMYPDGSTRNGSNYIYLFLAPEGYGLEVISDLKGLRKAGNLEAEGDGVWYSYLPGDLMKVDLEVFGVVNVDDPSDDVREGLLREDTAYYLCVLEDYKNFIPKDDTQLSVLCRPDDEPVMKELDRPKGEPERQNWHVRIPFDWRKADNCRVLNGSNDPQPAGAIQKAGSLLYISVQPLTDPDRGDSGNSGGGGGGCDSGMGSFALLAVATFLLRKGR